jgi:hypothetical protein
MYRFLVSVFLLGQPTVDATEEGLHGFRSKWLVFAVLRCLARRRHECKQNDEVAEEEEETMGGREGGQALVVEGRI